ncbi:MAG: hypothetical protein JXB62_05640 [Pirellulales bacterium]|nr:hypothetical protein [Pirellulales bacterium]
MAEDHPPDSPKDKAANRAAYVALVLVLVAVGAGVSVYLVSTKAGSHGQPEADPGRLVRVFKAQKTSHRIAISAYGTTRASAQWAAIAEVTGRAVAVDPRFEPGEILPAGLPLVTIDRTDYELAVRRLRAEASATKIQLDESDQTKENLNQILEPQKRQLALARSEYQRQLAAYQRSAISLSVLEAAENAYVTNLTAVQQTQNSLALLREQRARTEALLDAANARLAQADRDLSKCEIRLPFAARCASKSVEQDQYVVIGQPLGTFLAMESAEVVALVETRKMRFLFPDGITQLGTLDLSRMSHDESFWKQIRIPVAVTWGLGDQPLTWYGRVTRVGSSLDPGTQTVPVIIEVPRPYENVQPGIRPPLIPDVFCEITAYGATADDVVVIPRDALHDGRVYLLRQGKLHIQPVKVMVREKDLAVVSEGIEPGELVILTDLSPAMTLAGLALATEGAKLRGQVVENPVSPRTRIDFPEGIFEEGTPP